MSFQINKQDKIQRIDNALESLHKHYEHCTLCPRKCGINRQKGEFGFCETGSQASISQAVLHYGEEPVLSGYFDCKTGRPKRYGSGTLFFSGCNLKCLFCQNYQISWEMQGKPLSALELSDKMLLLQQKGALNINLVSPNHVLLPILEALRIAYTKDLHIPLVYNTNGYDKAEIIKLLDGIVDIYLPDMKYFSSETAVRYSRAPEYFLHTSSSITEMYCQQPALALGDTETAESGMIIRHLILPGQSEDSIQILKWIANNLSTRVALSLMSQYHPCFKAPQEIQRNISISEYRSVLNSAYELGFETMYIQPEPFQEEEHRMPDFKKKDPFDWD